MIKHQLLRAFISIVVSLSILAMIAFAAEMTQANWFYHLLGKDTSQQIEMPQESKQQFPGKGSICSDRRVTKNGYSITLDSSNFDGCRVMLKFCVDGPEGMSFDAERYYLVLETNMELPNAEDGSFSVSHSSGKMLEDDDPNDSSFTFLWECIFHAPDDVKFSNVNGIVLSIHIDSIRKSENSTNTLIAEGPWDFTVKYPDDLLATNTVELLESPLMCQAKRELWGRKYNVNLKLTSFQLRVLSATIVYNKPLTGFWEGVDLKPIFLVMDDGSRMEAQFKTWVNRGSYAECTYSFEGPVSLEDVAYVEFEHMSV